MRHQLAALTWVRAATQTQDELRWRELAGAGRYDRVRTASRRTCGFRYGRWIVACQCREYSAAAFVLMRTATFGLECH